MSLSTQQRTKSPLSKPKVEPKEKSLVRVPNSQFLVDVETGIVYLSQEQLKVLTSALR